MQIFLSIIRFLIWGGFLPSLLGVVMLRRWEKEYDLLDMVLCGYILIWAVMQLIAVPMIYLRQSFQAFCGLTVVLLILFLGIAIWRDRKNVFKRYCFAVKQLVKGDFPTILFRLLVLAQAIYVSCCYLVNDDDAFYVASAQTSLDTDTMYVFDPYTGDPFVSFPARYVLSPFSLFVAFMSRMVGVKAPAMAHTFLPFVFIILVYVVYKQWARFLFQDNQKAQTVFMYFVMLVYAFCDYTTRARGMMMFSRIWQGKAVLATILLPLILVFGMRMIRDTLLKRQWYFLFLLMLASCLVSSMGIMLAAIELGICGIIASLYQRNWKTLLYTVLCCIPNGIYAIIYILIR